MEAASVERRCDTGFSADSVEWCPVDGARHVLAVGTYQVDKSDEDTFSPAQRRGRILLFKADEDEASEIGNGDFSQSLDFPAVLDMKWRSCRDGSGRPTLATVDATGEVGLLALGEEEILVVLRKTQVTEEHALALSLDWNDRRECVAARECPKLVISDSGGHVHVTAVSESGELNRTYSSRRHDFESWIACFDAWNDSVVFSGGDDAHLVCSDIRVDPSSPPVFRNRRTHAAGVTSLLSCAARQNTLFSGSYDETLCEWDTRIIKGPLHQTKVGGGIWRIRQHPKDPTLLALACMHEGFKIVRKSSEASFETVALNEEHGSLAYGVDWRRMDGEAEADRGRLQLASCSFYDHLLTLWSIDARSQKL